MKQGDIERQAQRHPTRLESLFIDVLLWSGDVQKAATAAGYDRTYGYRLSRRPHVARELRERRDKAINVKLAPLALSTMRELMSSPGVRDQVRFQAARWTLEAAGHGAAAGQLAAQVDPDKPLTEMSLAELQAFISAGRAALDTLHQPRDITPADGPQTIEHQPDSTGSAQDSAQPGDAGDLM